MNILHIIGGTAKAIVLKPLDFLVVEPLQGLLEITAGFVLTVPEAVKAAASAALDNVREQIPTKGKFLLLAGSDLLASGLHKLRWHLVAGAIAAFYTFGLPGFLVVATVGMTVYLAVLMAKELGQFTINDLASVGQPGFRMAA